MSGAGAFALARPESLGSEHDSLTPLIASPAVGRDLAGPSVAIERDSPETMERKVSYGSGGYGNIRMRLLSIPTSAMRTAEQNEQTVLTVESTGRPSDRSPWFSPMHSGLLHKLVHGIVGKVKS